MSVKAIPTPTNTVVCDLCKEPIEKYGDRVDLIYNPYSRETNRRPARWRLAWYGYLGKPRDNDYKKTEVDWDFHPQCLIEKLIPIINGEDNDD